MLHATRRPLLAAAGAVLSLLLAGCGSLPETQGPPRKEILFAVTATMDLIQVNAGQPQRVLSRRPVTGLPAGEQLVGIDYRVARGVLYALSRSGRLYTLDTGSGALKPVGPAPSVVPLTGTLFGFDFNPAADRIRITVGNKNYRLQTNGVIDGEGPPNTGLPGSLQYVTGDPGAGTTPKVSGAAYTNSTRSATLPTATALFDLEVNRDVLVRQNPANAGDLTTIGPLGVDATGVDGFDVSGGPGQTAYAVMTVAGAPGLYRVDLASGAAELVGSLPAGLQGLAIK
jgi:hypothetical protein